MNDAPHAAGRLAANRTPEPAVLDLGFDSSGLSELRATVAQWAGTLLGGGGGGNGGGGGGGEAVDDLLLVVNELCGNAIRHGGGQGRVRLWTDGYLLMCRVTDSGPGISDAEAQGQSRPEPHIAGGRGLWIARRLADLRIDSGPSGTTVTATLPLS